MVTRHLHIERLTRLVFVILCARLFPRLGYIVAGASGFELFSWQWDMVHHAVQMLPALLVMLLFSRTFSLRDIGFNLNRASWSLKTTGIFALGWLIAMSIGVLVTGSEDTATAGDLLFAFTLTGLSEEVLFRSFVIGMLLPVFSKSYTVASKQISQAGLISVVIFALAHVSFSLSPLAISSIDPMQQLFAIGLGIFYAVCFEYTHSLLAPVLIHNLSDGLLLVIIKVFSLF